MKKAICFAIFLAVVLISSGADAATVRAEASPLLGPGYIEVGVPFTVDIYMHNNDGVEHYGYSMPLAFYSPDEGIINVTHRDVGGYGPYNSILMLNDFDTYWTILNQWTGFSFDGSLADTINHTVATLTAWPPDVGEQLFIQFALQTDEEGEFCIDSVSVPNTTPPMIYDWLFDYPTTFNGPYCWQVVSEIPQDPEIGVNPSSFVFSAVEGDPPPPPQVLQITNTAAGTLNWTATWNSSWLSVSPAFGTAPSSVQIFANTTGMSTGTYYDTITVSDPNAINNPVPIPVQLNITEPPPTIDLSQTYFSFNAIADGDNPPDQILHVANIGGGTLNWTASNSESWLTISPESGVNDGDITLSVDITGLTYAIYYDTIVVSDPAATNSPRIAAVRLEIASSLPVLAVEPDYIYVAVDVDEPLPNDRYIEITNAGAGTMNYEADFTVGRILSLDPDSGSVPQTVTVHFDSIQGLAGQDFYDTVWIHSVEAINSPQMVVFQFHLSHSPARIIASRDSIFIELHECGQGIGPFNFPPLTIYNGGGEPFTFTITNSQEWLTVSPQTAPAPTTVSIDVDYRHMSPGMYYDTLVVSAYNAVNTPKLVKIIVNVLPTSLAPEVWVNTQYVTVAAQEERPGKDYFIEMNNANPGCMEWSLQEDITWLNYSVDSSENRTYPWTIRFLPNGFGMIMGHYEETAFVVAPDATNTPFPIYLDIYVWKFYGDVNYDGKVNLLDIIYMIRYLYMDGPEPIPERRVGDTNCDYRINLNDITAIIDYLYVSLDPLCGNPY